ncbi:MAG: SpoIIIAH-like family protein [Oscillospiraceae bacterium]|nr:SpoIIIAH-like family protein [Oscillospiraceae bacterium]MBP3698721.1 SpoIIIAH-like family protein [Oscillospiraceae bacterium]
MALQEKKEKRKVEKKVRTPLKGQWKRHAVVLAVLVLVGTSVYLNWRYADNVAETGKILGQATLVNQNGEGVTQTGESGDAVSVSGSYFDTARLSRQQARDSAISMLQEAELDENATEDVLNEASLALQVLASYTVAEAQIESLVTAKGYEDCVVFMGEDSCSVVVADPDGVDSTDAARIKDIVISETDYTAAQIKIMEAE